MPSTAADAGPTLEALAAGLSALPAADGLVAHGGLVTAVRPDGVVVEGLPRTACIGDVVRLGGSASRSLGEVLHVEAGQFVIAPVTPLDRVSVGDVALHAGNIDPVPDARWLGRVVNALGEPMDGKGPLPRGTRSQPPGALGALGRARVAEPFRTGVRVIDLFTPLCIGQRFGIFAGSGVGKSTLLSMLARAGAFDAVVVGLVGERSREVREFVEDTLGVETMAKSLIVVATGDESAVMRRRAAPLSMRFAEALRDQGKRVLYLLDSVTRYAHALRETGITAGQPPVQRGYPATVFSELPMLLERAGPGGANGGSITAIATVLVDGDDHNDPVADTMRGILDGHLVLERAIADSGRYPPVNALASISRLSGRVWKPQEADLVASLRAMMARFEETRDLRLLGGWKPGSDADLDKAVGTVPHLYRALNQRPSDPPSIDPFAELAGVLRDGAQKS